MQYPFIKILDIDIVGRIYGIADCSTSDFAKESRFCRAGLQPAIFPGQGSRGRDSATPYLSSA